MEEEGKALMQGGFGEVGEGLGRLGFGEEG